MLYTVNELSKLAGVSVRTLHHYDEIGLLKPQAYTAAGYRQYGQQELERLQQILFFKELDFELVQIKNLLDSPGFDSERALLHHRELLEKRRERLERLLQTIDKTIEAMKGISSMENDELFENFDMTEIEEHKAKYADEVKEKYGAWAAKDKTKHYGKREWAEVTAAAGAISADLVALMQAGRAPEDEDVQQLITQHHAYISKYFYECPLEVYEGLASLYVEDERFTKNIDKTAPGLAHFQSAAMKVYCMLARKQ